MKKITQLFHKTFIIFPLMLAFTATNLQAQVMVHNYDVAVVETDYGNTVADAVELNINAPEDQAVEVFNQFFEQNFDKELDKVEQNDQRTLYKLKKVELINDEVVDLYLKAQGPADSSSMHMAVAFGYDNFVDLSDEEQYKLKMAWLKENLLDFYQEQKLTKERDRLREQREDVIDERQDLTKDNARLQKKIERRFSQIDKRLKKIESYRTEKSENEEELIAIKDQLRRIEQDLIDAELALEQIDNE